MVKEATKRRNSGALGQMEGWVCEKYQCDTTCVVGLASGG